MSGPSNFTQEPPAYNLEGGSKAPSSAAAKHQQADQPVKKAGGYQSIPQEDAAHYATGPAGYAMDDDDEEDLEAGFAPRNGDGGQRRRFDGVVADAPPELRAQFIKKVYSILFLQILATTVVAAAVSAPHVSDWVHQNQWSIFVPLIGSLVSMIVLFFKRHSHPLNLILLSVFTLFEALSMGLLVSYIKQKVVLQALIITLFTFAGLTFFTLWASARTAHVAEDGTVEVREGWDFSALAPYLFSSIWLLIGAGFVQFFLPYNRVTDLIFASLGCLVFSGYIVFDTWLITKRLHVDEWVFAVVSLYLDILNLFISVLRILNGTND